MMKGVYVSATQDAMNKQCCHSPIHLVSLHSAILRVSVLPTGQHQQQSDSGNSQRLLLMTGIESQNKKYLDTFQIKCYHKELVSLPSQYK